MADWVSIRPRMHNVMETGIFFMASSCRRDQKKPSNANFVALYEVVNGVATLPG